MLAPLSKGTWKQTKLSELLDVISRLVKNGPVPNVSGVESEPGFAGAAIANSGH